MNLENIFIDFEGDFDCFEEIRKDLIDFPNGTFNPFMEDNYRIKIEFKGEDLLY